MPRKPLSPQDADAVTSIGLRLYAGLQSRNTEIMEATGRTDPSRLADAIAAAQADLAQAYAQVVAVVSRQR